MNEKEKPIFSKSEAKRIYELWMVDKKALEEKSAALQRAEEALEMALENIDISEYGEQVEIKSALAEIRSIKAGKP